MNTREYLKHFVTLLHEQWERALSDLGEDQFYFRPGDHSNHIAFTAWHWVRTEDSVVQFALQREQTVWLLNQLDERWGLPRVAQGSGMPLEEAHALRVPSVGDLLAYARQVWSCTNRYLEQARDEELSRITRVSPLGEIAVAQALGQTVLAHGNQHLGEIWLIRELQALTGSGQ